MKKIKLDAQDFQVLSKEQLRTIVAGGGSGGAGCLHGILCTDGDSQGQRYAGQCNGQQGGGPNCYCMPGGFPGGSINKPSLQCIATTIIIPPIIA